MLSVAKCALAYQTSAPSPTSRPSTSQPSIEDEVLANVREQVIGDHTLSAHNISEALLRRVADRIIRSSYERRFRMVAHDPDDQGAVSPTPASGPATRPASAPAPSSAPAVRIIIANPVAERGVLPQGAHEVRPPLRGFRAALADGRDAQPFELPPDADDRLRAAAAVCNQRLAFDGLLATLPQVIKELGPEFAKSAQAMSEDGALDAQAASRLRACGYPLDLLAHFDFEPLGENSAAGVVRLVARHYSAGGELRDLTPKLARAQFRFRQSVPGFRCAPDSGDATAEAFRLQLTRGTDWVAPNDGGALDIARQFAATFPATPLLFSVEQRFAAELERWARDWSLARSAPITILQEPRIVSQWAQDNARFGWVGAGKSAAVAASGGFGAGYLAPRYASRADDGSAFVPGDTYLIDTLRSAGLSVAQSPLLFQSGDLIAVREPRDGTLTLLVGEAEIQRNIALGLTADQVSEAFRIEFGAERVAILPGASFHLDFEVSVRAQRDGVLAFVNDTAAATDIILKQGIAKLEKLEILSPDAAKRANELLRASGNFQEFMQIVGEGLMRRALTPGVFPERAAREFSTGAADSGIGNFLVFLVAVDLYLSRSVDVVPEDRPGGFLRAMRRNEADRQEIRRILAGLGWRVVPVPSISNAERGINYLNGLHTREAYIMPTWGGFYEQLDQAAASAFRKALGESVRVIPVLSSESQRRAGAVRCAVSVISKPE